MVTDEDSYTEHVPLTASQTAKKPVLASEALLEDLAPEEPWRKGARWWSLLGGLLLLASAAPAWLQSPRSMRDAVPPAAAAGLALLCGIVPFPYVWRAIVMALVAAVIFCLGFLDIGPCAILNDLTGVWWMVHVAAVVLLPAALLFRERYRALPRVRYTLGVALFMALGFVGYCVLTISTGTLVTQITSGISLGAVVLSLLGFMGSQAPVAGSVLAAFIIAAISAQLTSVVVQTAAIGNDLVHSAPIAGVVAFVGAALVGALALAQLLAAASVEEARRIDFRRDSTERPPMPSLTSDSWTGRR